ncbi:2-polyprenyl-6-methoxyphenol hydroxylase-like FAD-dependent oxidoreductase [Haloactinopolyspora alba]|uniref:2-polyprenyl-6-methoxyphenol hydroxylase-like FAD-dependent oxidoreductase n=1 Tax=Haloactinopolyspora alba TaxID=648780 RepID=A0A2P8DJ30_9ACTN|nr:FAD-dependent monooxygenase [Haloactinopolyspora alba]PSK97236.1 2-polyprenyl-6-methoxyphenol hydroxylase-like FAD-dependent oxidoreductase [Haloactinopolyspora alba]
MNNASDQVADVLVVGAGPTGLLLAGDLAAAGVSCTVLERRADESNLTRAFAVHARTLELLDARGVADALVSSGNRVDRLNLFGGVEVDLSGLPTRFPFVLVTPQYVTEAVLRERAVAAGARIVDGAEVDGLHQDDEGVRARFRAPDGARGVARSTYLVGADGAHSTVRNALGLAFPGEAAVQSVMLADVLLAEPPTDVLVVGSGEDGFAFVAPFGDGWYRVIAWDRHRQVADDVPVSLDEVRDVTTRVLGTDHGMHDARWLSRFHSDERLVPWYRVGRTFLAGDAAHVHSPAGGQGMNIGLQDAANLGWKLVAALHGWAAPGLLDSYHGERHPVGRSVVQGSGTLLRMALLGPAPLRAVRNAAGSAVARIGPIERKAGEFVSGLAIAYPRPRGEHSLVGSRVPDVTVVGPDGAGRLYERLRDGRFVLLTGQDHHGLIEPWADRVNVVTTVDRSQGLTLVRPDGYVAWATDTKESIRRDVEVRAALIAWCGPPASG